jgi:hypothetical protein
MKTKHGSLADHDIIFFKRKFEVVKKTRLDSSGCHKQKSAAAIESSYLVVHRLENCIQ